MADSALLLQSKAERHAPYPTTSSSHDVQTHGEENHTGDVPHAGQHDREHCQGVCGESVTALKAMKYNEAGQSEKKLHGEWAMVNRLVIDLKIISGCFSIGL